MFFADMNRIMENQSKMKYTDSPCTRCQGKGEIKGFAHVLAGVCFRCWGAGLEPEKPTPTIPINDEEASLFASCPYR